MLWLSVIVIPLLIVLSGFFSGSETALTATSRARMRQLEKSGDRRAALVNVLIRDRERLIGAVLLGNNLVNILASALATSLFLTLFGQAGVAYATIVMTLFVLIFGEVLPKTLAIGNPDQTARSVAPLIRPIVAVFSPVTITVQFVVHGMLRLFGHKVQPGLSMLSPVDEIRGQVDLLHAEGSVVKAERDRLDGLLDLGELDVADVMVHRTTMHMVNADDPAEQVLESILNAPFTRVPIWQNEPENIVGIIHVKDLLRRLSKGGAPLTGPELINIASPAWFVPETTNLTDQLNAFLKRKAHFALVVDEYGEVQGLITLEDIIEEIVGDIVDEHDISVEGVRQQPDGSLIVDGAVAVRDVNRAMDWDLPDEVATTIAGLVIHEARIIPDPGQTFTFFGFRFRVLRKTRNRITSLRVTPLSRVADPSPPEA
ncbi:MAG: HlyC/CorC family transporter [Alphaproteobacteria bacterium]